MDFVYIGVFICALAFALVVIYASLVLKRAANTMESISHTLNEVEQKMHYITPELQKTLEETGQTVDDLNEKLAATDSLFTALDDAGVSVYEGDRFVQRQTDKTASWASPKNRNRLTKTIKWADVMYKLYKRTRS
ncbi:hypothetical protein GCM10028778_18310 [Barrientosiimonas marina]|uniref:DUF948 domain-containing protein n=1 Tax=Lentibacillus kimchii TaxID=1542911 RepID=A0ABW2US25_9BACI